jgi:hypothetical protein
MKVVEGNTNFATVKQASGVMLKQKIMPTFM